MGELTDTATVITPAEYERLRPLRSALKFVVEVVDEILCEDGYGNGNRKSLERALGSLSAAADLLESYGDVDCFTIARSAAFRRRSIRAALKRQDDPRGAQGTLFEGELSA
jgi:hypothetical protein